MASLFEQAQQEGASAPQQKPLDEAISNEVANQQASNPENNPIGFGTIPATEEENQQLEVVLDAVEKQIHGPFRDDIIDLLSSQSELWISVATASQSLIEGVNQKLTEQGAEVEPDMFFGENGIIQSTVEMVFELGVAAGVPNSGDSNQLDAAFMKVMQEIGDELHETDDTSAVEAQELALEMEFGDGVIELAEEGFQLAGGTEALGAFEEEALEQDPLAGAGAGTGPGQPPAQPPQPLAGGA